MDAFSYSKKVVPRGLEPRTFRLLAERSNQLSYETDEKQTRPPTIEEKASQPVCVCVGGSNQLSCFSIKKQV